MAGKLSLSDGVGELVALITCPNQESADKLADELVGKFAAACVNIIPKLTSVYRWKGEICRDSEWLLVVKTRDEKREQVAALVSEVHPYDEPELIFLPIQSGSTSYLSWLREQVS